LSLGQLDTGPEISPDVQMMHAGNGLVVALKSGNFGVPPYFEHAAWTMEAPQ